MLPKSILVSLLAFVALGEALNAYTTGETCSATDTKNCLSVGSAHCYTVAEVPLVSHSTGAVCTPEGAGTCECPRGQPGLKLVKNRWGYDCMCNGSVG
ncbi:hypothetical protein Ptr902_06837 [Pyrenophora tritici-repentis]|nr:hypothetical protein Ptr902_06837 [Pyrenophora tritici-repentis]